LTLKPFIFGYLAWFVSQYGAELTSAATGRARRGQKGIKIKSTIMIKRKQNTDSSCYPAEIGHLARVLLDGSHLSKAWESSGELGSVMILNPTFGNSLWKVQFVGQ